MEFNASGISKGSALITLSEILNIKPCEIIAIGDNHNDISMLKVAGLSAAVNNALPEIKKICNYVCSSTNEEGAIAEIINKFVFTK